MKIITLIQYLIETNLLKYDEITRSYYIPNAGELEITFRNSTIKFVFNGESLKMTINDEYYSGEFIMEYTKAVLGFKITDNGVKPYIMIGDDSTFYSHIALIYNEMIKQSFTFKYIKSRRKTIEVVDKGHTIREWLEIIDNYHKNRIEKLANSD